MKIVIIWNAEARLLAETMENLITTSQYYLFTVICGGTSWENIQSTAGFKWASANGAPIEYLIEEDIDKLLNKMVKTADYLVAFNDNSQITKKIIMKFSTSEKHGTVIKYE